MNVRSCSAGLPLTIRVWNSRHRHRQRPAHPALRDQPRGHPRGRREHRHHRDLVRELRLLRDRASPADQPGPADAYRRLHAVLGNTGSFKNGDRLRERHAGRRPWRAGELRACTRSPGAERRRQLRHAAADTNLQLGTLRRATRAPIRAAPTRTPGSTAPPASRDAGGTLVPAVTLAQRRDALQPRRPALKVYAIRGGNLTSCDWTSPTAPIAANYTVVVNDIVSLRAVYGMNLTPAVNASPGRRHRDVGTAPRSPTNVSFPAACMP